MKKLMTLILCTAIFPPMAVVAQDVFSDTPLQSLPRMFGMPKAELETGLLTLGIENYVTDEPGLFNAVPFDSNVPSRIDAARFEPIQVAAGEMIQTKGIFPGRQFFYITDTGKDSRHNESGRIWRFDPETNELVKFFESIELINPKWIYYHSRDVGPDLLIVADLGEEPIPRAPGTGKGAKILSIPIDTDGLAGEPIVLHEGPPFRSPEGVTVIGESVIVSDWAAGSLTTRPEAPNDEFNQGAVFKLPLVGGEPIKLFEDHKWITVIGACQFFDANGKRFLRIIDIDGGRPQEIDPTFPRSGTVKYFTAEVLTDEPLVLGPLTEAVLFEDTPVDISSFLPEGAEIISTAAVQPAQLLDSAQGQNHSSLNGRLELIRSPNALERIELVVVYTEAMMDEPRTLTLSVTKGQLLGAVPQDNKHAGARVISFSGSQMSLSASADGTSRSVFVFPSNGGMPAVLWSGHPFEQPMGVQFSGDGKSLFVTDQAAGDSGMSVLFKVPLPLTSEIETMFAQTFE